MVFKVFIEPSAEIDLNETIIWYELQREGLGADFLHNFYDSISLLPISPLLFHKRYKDVRAIKIQNYPYDVYYFVSFVSVHIIAVTHEKRNPKIWKKRRK